MYRFIILFLSCVCLFADNNANLSFLVGEWQIEQDFYDCDWWAAGKGKGSAQVKETLGGKFLEMNYISQRENTSDYISHNFFSYDIYKKTYLWSQFDSYGYSTHYTGNFVSDKVLVMKSDNGWIRERKTFDIVSTKEFLLTIESSSSGKHFKKILVCKFIKQSATDDTKKPVASTKSHLQNHVEMLSQTIGERNSYKYEKLNEAAKYIESCLEKTSLEKKNHSYNIGEKKYTNIVFEKKGKKEDILLIGAHYDTAVGTPGADDNASGVAVLLELAKLLDKYESNYTIQFVFFTLEEPPYFRTSNMGSTQYAKYLKDNNQKIKLMICLEMLGFYSDEKIQKYPNPMLKQLYPAEANYVAVVSNYDNSAITKTFFNYFKENSKLPAQVLIAPPSLTGVDFSDHLSFWKYNYPALMITDTSFYRNDNYHQHTDTLSTLDFDKMASVTSSVYEAVKKQDTE